MVSAIAKKNKMHFSIQSLINVFSLPCSLCPSPIILFWRLLGCFLPYWRRDAWNIPIYWKMLLEHSSCVLFLEIPPSFGIIYLLFHTHVYDYILYFVRLFILDDDTLIYHKSSCYFVRIGCKWLLFIIRGFFVFVSLFEMNVFVFLW